MKRKAAQVAQVDAAMMGNLALTTCIYRRNQMFSKPRLTIFMLLSFALIVLHAEETLAEADISYGDNSKAGQFIQVNGIRLYYETYGMGQAMLLVHGNGGSIAVMCHQIEHFSKEYKVMAVDTRGHGKSELGEGRLTYDQMAEDLNLFLDKLNLQSVYVVGWSDGGILGLLLAMRHPDKVGKLALMGASLRPDGLYNWALERVMQDLVRVESMISQGDQTKPWQAIRQHLLLLIEQPNIPTVRLKAVQAPTLVMAGDRDIIIDNHTLEVFHALPKANLCIFPGATHMFPYEHPLLFNQTVDAFFQNPFKCPDSKESISRFY
jgi:pimeloyl-ACP methyl ester carboxylesterase